MLPAIFISAIVAVIFSALTISVVAYICGGEPEDCDRCAQCREQRSN